MSQRPGCCDQQGHDSVEVKSAELLEDGKSVRLKINDMQPVMQMRVDYELTDSDWANLMGTIHNTISVVRNGDS